MNELPRARAPLYVLAFGYLIFVIYGSLVPLNFTPRPIADAVEAFRHIPFLQLGIASRADWVANLLLFIPLAFLLGLLVVARRSGFGKVFAYTAVWSICFALCVGIEFTQLFFPPRVVSQNDILAEGVGAGVGLALHGWWGERFASWFERAWARQARRDTLVLALQGYLFVLLAYNILPLDLTLSPADFYHKWKEGRIILLPFAALPAGTAAVLYEIATDMGIWIPAGLLWRLTGGNRIASIGIKGALFALAIEAAQLFVYSRVTDVTDVLMGGVGAAAGAAVTHPRTRGVMEVDGPGGAAHGSAIWWAALALWVVAVLAIFWFPYNFSFEPAFVANRLKDLWRVPLQTYYGGSEYRAATEVLHKVGFFLPGGIVWVLLSRSATRALLPAAGWLLAAIVAALAEGGQIFLPGKVADFTDWALKFLGAVLGMWLSQRILSAPAASPHDAPIHPNAPTRIRSAGAAAYVARTGAGAFAPARSSLGPESAWGQAWAIEALAIVILSFCIAAATRLSFVPYNVRELMLPGAWVFLSALGLALCVYWITASHLRFLAWASAAPPRLLTLPLWLVVHGLATWTLIRIAVPMEGLQDIVGSPILGWPWEWEMLLRFLALDAAVSLAAVGAALIVWSLYRSQAIGMLMVWLIACALLIPLLHWGIVTEAATDNLTELMRGGGTAASSLLIGAGQLCIFLAASGVSAGLAAPGRKLAPFFIAAFAIPLSYALFRLGTEPVIFKYEKVFSGLQFLLSTDREHYVGGAALALRYFLAVLAAGAAIAALQAPQWKSLLRTASRHVRRAPRPV